MVKEYYFRYHYYSSFLKGTVDFENWKGMSPKEVDLCIEIQEEINESKSEIINRLNNIPR
jgi:hypothetical protein